MSGTIQFKIEIKYIRYYYNEYFQLQNNLAKNLQFLKGYQGRKIFIHTI